MGRSYGVPSGGTLPDELYIYPSTGDGLPAGVLGDILYHDGSDFVTLTIGGVGEVLTVAAGVPSWAVSAGGLTGVAAGDVWYWNGATVTVLTAVAGAMLKMNAGGTAPEYLVAVQGDIVYRNATEMVVLNAVAGEMLKSNTAGTAPEYLVAVQGDVYYRDADGVQVLNAVAGEMLKINTAGTAPEYLVAVQGDVYYRDADGVQVLNAVAGEPLKINTAGTAPEYLVGTHGAVYFRDADGLQVLSPDGAKIGYVLTHKGLAADPVWEPMGVETGSLVFAASQFVLGVAFATPMTAATYGVMLTQELTGTEAHNSCAFNTRTVNGFTVTLSGSVPAGETVTVHWMVNRV